MGVFSMMSMSIPNSYAAWDEGAQGIKVTSTDGDFDVTSVQSDFFGVDFGGTAASDGVSVQTNAFVDGQTIGTNYLWAQSVTEARPIPTTTYNSYTCGTQSGTYTCEYPNEVQMKGTFQMETDEGPLFFECPGGWTRVNGSHCWIIIAESTEATKDVGDAGDKRFDLYAYMELQSDGEVYAEQKYRTCDDDDGPCTGYTSLKSGTSDSVANSNEEFTSDQIGGTTYYPSSATVGYEGGQVFVPLTGTYIEHTYQVNDGSAVESYKTGNIVPGEANDDICWWDSISDSGGASPNFKSSAKYDTSCDSS